MPVVLLTDAFFFALIALVAVYALVVARKPHLQTAWRKLARDRTAMVSLVVIAFYFVIALLDSIHFRPRLESPAAAAAGDAAGAPIYSNEVVSLFDRLVLPLGGRFEKTYSEPFAAQAYVKEMIEQDGVVRRGYPRLAYGGVHLDDPARASADAAWRAVSWGVAGVLACAVAFALACAWAARRRRRRMGELMRAVARGATELPLRAVAITVALIVVAVFVCAGLSADYHVFGTDKIGQDVLYQALKSVRTGFLIGTLTTLIMLPFALVLGVCAGYFLGWVDDVIQYLYTTLNSIPGVLLIAAMVLMLQLYMDQHGERFDDLVTRADARLLFLCAILGITSWTGLCRLLRAETLKVKEMDYVAAAQVLGTPRALILLRHVLPNVMHIVVITVALDFSGLVLAEAVLSYVNIGVDPTMNSWGNMINGARLEMAREPVVWWPLAAAMLFLFGLVLCANLLADGVRNAFDPRSEAAHGDA